MTARLIVMDIDSTLINQEVIDLLGEEAGVGEQVAQITERAMRGELDFKQALEERVGLLAGLDESVFERTFERVTFTPGALELVRSAHSKGWKVGVVSGGFHEVADKIVAAAGIDFCLANRLEVVDGKLTGKLAVVIGSEGFGISKLVKEQCDFVVSMPMVGRITSLNASNAAAVLVYEVRRQRDLRAARG